MRNQLDGIRWFNNVRQQIPYVMLQRFRRVLGQPLSDRPWWRDVGLPRLLAAIALAQGEMFQRFMGITAMDEDAVVSAGNLRTKAFFRGLIATKGKGPEAAPIDVISYFNALIVLERLGPDMTEDFLRDCIVAAARMVAKECGYTDEDLVSVPVRRGAAEVSAADAATPS